MFHIGRARHPGPGPRSFITGQLSIEFVNVGGGLTHGDLALDSVLRFWERDLLRPSHTLADLFF